MMLTDQQALRMGYLSREEQLVQAQEVTLRQGDGRTLCCHQLALPNRLSATIQWDRCMDISHLRYAGIPLCYLGKSDERSDSSPQFEQRFSGGMLYTCGLLNVGPQDDAQPTHGRIHLQSACMRSVRRVGDALVLQGQMREGALFGENLRLTRRLTFPLNTPEVHLSDTLENLSPTPQPYMLLYHINLGYPLLSEHLRLTLPDGTQTTAATAHARKHQAEHAFFTPPQADFQEQDFYHRLPAQDGYCALTAENSMLGIGLGLRYRADTLPYLVQWRCLRSGDYVLGLEPANNHAQGRTQAARDQCLPRLQPFETITTALTLTCYDLPQQRMMPPADVTDA